MVRRLTCKSDYKVKTENKSSKIEVKMSILEELSNPIRQIDAETVTNARSERSRGRTQRKVILCRRKERSHGTAV